MSSSVHIQRWVLPGLLVLFLLSAGLLQAQQINKPVVTVVAPPAPTLTPEPTPIAYTGITDITNLNYVRTWEAMGPLTNPATFTTQPYTAVKQATAYVDGLGRPLQTVMKQATPNAQDMVSPVVYDVYSREPFKYMPYAATTADGNFKLNPFADQKTTLQTLYPGEQVFYNKTDFEASPLNRPLKGYAPGNSWAGSGKGTEQQYLISTTANNVRIWTIGSLGTDVPVNAAGTAGMYADGQLYLSKTIDENGNAVAEFKDKEGKVIVKKVQVAATVDEAYTGWLSTYYVYDDLGMLRFVIPPKAVTWLLANAWSFSGTEGAKVADELCFRYEYDSRQRMIAKKVPGAAWTYMVYDRRDRLIFTQDGNMRNNNQWLATLYDVLNRPVLTGMISFSGTRATLQSNADTDIAATSNPNGGTVSFGRSAPSPQSSNITVNSLQSGTKVYNATNSIMMDVGFDSDNGSDITLAIVTATPLSPGSETVDISDNPIKAAYNFIALTQTYYDNYSFNTSPVRTYAVPAFSAVTNTALYPVATPTAAQQALVPTRGMVTGTRVRTLPDPSNLAAGTWLSTVMFYDDRGRVLQTQSDNYKGGVDVASNRYNFTGAVLTSLLVHNNPQSPETGLQQFTVQTDMNYDHAGRLTQVSKSVEGGASKVIAVNAYNELGQLSKKDIGRTSDNAAVLETQDYTYNVRGWLKGINLGYARDPASSTTKWFGMELNYDWGFGTNQFNGNIAGTKWKSRGDNVQRSYGYGYDKVNRLLFGDFAQGSTYADDAKVSFDMYMGTTGADNGTAYDENGNILKMKQWGLKLNSSPIIDDLTYTYNYNGSVNTNKLLNVIEALNVNDPLTKLGDFRISQTYLTTLGNPTVKPATATDYDYDINGNLKKDSNKDIDLSAGATQGIQYNHLNLPWKINVKNKGTITYIYDAAGNKLEKITSDNTVPTGNTASGNKQTSYVAGFVYENNVMQFFGQEEGRVRVIAPLAGQPSTFAFDYFLKDHLGNTRMVLTDQGQTDMYPAATMESATAPNEEKFYSGLPETRTTNLPANYPSIAGNAKVAKVSGAAGAGNYKIGPGITLKVMAGDRFNVMANSWWQSVSNPTSQTFPVADLVNALAGGIAGAGGKATASELISNNVLSPGATSFLNSQPVPAGKPKAFLNWVLFDEQFNIAKDASGNIIASGYSGIDPVGISGVYTSHTFSNLPINKSGYLYIYVSNETPNIDVFFDNLQVTHIRGPLIEETHYYPFGLTMAGISAKSAGSLENRMKWNKGSELQSKEFSDGSGLELYSTFYRSLDPQLGRWWQLDPKPDYSQSLYSGMNNNPILVNDPLGDTGVVRWRSGFLGLKKNEARHVGGAWINSKTRQSVNLDKVSNNDAKNLMKDYNGLNNTKEFDKVTNEINTSTVNVVFHRGATGQVDPAINTKTNELNVTVAENRLIPAPVNEGNVPVTLTGMMNMGHEVGHAYDLLIGKCKQSYISISSQGQSFVVGQTETNAMYYENILRSKAGLPLRTTYTIPQPGMPVSNNDALISRDSNEQPVSVSNSYGDSYIIK